MKLSEFDYQLPISLIAQRPVYPRDQSKLLDINDNKYTDRIFSELPDLLTEKDLIIINDTKVIPTRLIGKRNTTSINMTLHKKINHTSWFCFIKPAKKIKVGDTLLFRDLSAKVDDKFENGEIKVSFNCNNYELLKKLKNIGHMPLPPYIKRKNEENLSDLKDYQSIFSKNIGAIAAPTASLHFTKELTRKLRLKKIQINSITLHVGAGTFLPVKENDVLNHKMHEEWGYVSQSVVNNIENCKKNGGRVICVGTTTLRILESSVQENKGVLKKFSGYTNIFITPGYKFTIPDILLTNFHLPKSTLLMLVYAFSGINEVKEAYNHAIKKNYRFYSYGDCCMLRRKNE